MTLADRIVVLNEGRVQQVGAPLELYNAPANAFVAGFIGSPRMNMIPAEARGEGVDVGQLGVLPGPPEGMPPGVATIGIRPENLRIEQPGGAAARVLMIEHLGNDVQVELELPDGRVLMASIPPATRISVGEMTTIGVGNDLVHGFSTEGQRLASWVTPTAA